MLDANTEKECAREELLTKRERASRICILEALGPADGFLADVVDLVALLHEEDDVDRPQVQSVSESETMYSTPYQTDNFIWDPPTSMDRRFFICPFNHMQSTSHLFVRQGYPSRARSESSNIGLRITTRSRSVQQRMCHMS